MSKGQCGVKACFITVESLFCHCVGPGRADASAERGGVDESRALWARKIEGRKSRVGRSITFWTETSRGPQVEVISCRQSCRVVASS